MGDEAGAWKRAVAAAASGEPIGEVAAGLVARMTEDERRSCLDGDLPFWAGLTDLGVGGYHRRPFLAARVPRLGVPGFAFSDGPRGVVVGPATCFPVSMARGATWDVDLEERIGEAIGRELTAVGADLYGGVCVNVLRHPAWGRAQETYGEDPHHVGELGAALTRGVQRHAMACVKHFACNSMENARFKVDVTVDDTALHEVFLPHFRRIVDEGVACVMSAYNAVNGEWCGQSHALLTGVLREEWGFDGFVISDWLFGLRDAGPSILAGLDVEMPAPMIRAGGLDAALADGTVGWPDIDACVTRTMAALLRHAVERGGEAAPPDVLACPAHRALAREAATKAAVLLQNEPVDGVPVLPLDAATLGTVAVLGPLADVRNLGDGGSSDVHAPTVVTPLAGIRAALGDERVVHHDGADLDAAAALAATADVAVVIVGCTKADEGEFIGAEGTSHLVALMPGPDDPAAAEAFAARVAQDPWPDPPADAVGPLDSGGFATGGDRRSLRLHDHDEALLAAVAAGNPRTVAVLVGGSAFVVEAWRTAVPAIVQAWYSGMEGGHALADVLLGVVDAAGRLPFSVPTDEAHLPPFDPDADAVTYDRWHGYWRLERDGHPPRFPFGFGLSYTTWDVALVEPDDVAAGDGADGTWDQRVAVANTGERDGATVVQVYARRPGRRERRLVGFRRVALAAGQRTEVVVPVATHSLAVREGGRWILPEGTYELSVGQHAADVADAVTARVRATVRG
jgi:beta-glucosidase-like glycosyl hydrolase